MKIQNPFNSEEDIFAIDFVKDQEDKTEEILNDNILPITIYHQFFIIIGDMGEDKKLQTWLLMNL